MDKLKEYSEEYFIQNVDHYVWIKDPFKKIPSELSISEKEQLIDLQSEMFHFIKESSKGKTDRDC